jgi:hypothetical protein
LRHLFVAREGDGRKSAIAEEGEAEFKAGTTTMSDYEKCVIEGKKQYHDDEQRG